MMKKRSWWLAAICGVLMTGCSDCEIGGAGAWGTSAKQKASGVNVFNCSAYELGVFWVAGTPPDWDDAESTVLPVASGCGQGQGQAQYIPFSSGTNYTVRVAKDYANCAASQGESNYFEPTDCSPHATDRAFTGDSSGADTWEVH